MEAISEREAAAATPSLDVERLLSEEGPLFWRCVNAIAELNDPDHPPLNADIVRRIRDVLALARLAATPEPTDGD